MQREALHTADPRTSAPVIYDFTITIGGYVDPRLPRHTDLDLVFKRSGLATMVRPSEPDTAILYDEENPERIIIKVRGCFTAAQTVEDFGKAFCQELAKRINFARAPGWGVMIEGTQHIRKPLDRVVATTESATTL